jgi:hypothetical protein
VAEHSVRPTFEGENKPEEGTKKKQPAGAKK